MLPFDHLFSDTKGSDLSFPQTKAVKSKVLDTIVFSFDSFIDIKKKKKESSLPKVELKALHNLHKQKHLVILKAYKCNTIVINENNANI